MKKGGGKEREGAGQPGQGPARPGAPGDLEPQSAEALQRLHLEYIERVRQAEAGRLAAEARAEELEDRQGEQAARQRQELREQSEQLEAARAKLGAAQSKTYALEIRHAQLKVSRDALEAERQELGEANLELEARLRDQAREILVLTGQRDQKQAEAQELATRFAAAAALAEQQEAQLRARREEVQELTGQLGASRAEVQDLADRLAAAELGVRQAEDVAVDLRAELDQARTLARQSEEQLREARARVLLQEELLRAWQEEQRTQEERLRADLAEAGSQAARREEQLGGLREVVLDLRAALAQSQEEASAQGMRLAAAADALLGARAEVQDLKDGLKRAEADRKALETERRELREKLGRQGQERDRQREAKRDEELRRLHAQVQEAGRRHAVGVSALNGKISALQQELVFARGAVVEAEHRAEAAKNTLSFRLGYTLIHGFKSWGALRRLPGELLDIHRESLRRRATKLSKAAGEFHPGEHSAELVELERIYAVGSLSAAEEHARSHFKAAPQLAGALTHLVRLAVHAAPQEVLRLAREATQLDPRPFRRKWLAFLLFDLGNITEASTQLLALPQDIKLKSSERNKADYIAGCLRLLSNDFILPERSRRAAYRPELRRVLYVAASALPHHISGYTLRTQALVAALRVGGWDVVCATRPGYPQDRADVCALTPGGECQVEGVHYQRLAGPHRRKTPLDQYIKAASESIAAKARELRPAVIHAASNYEAALPALMAARSLGIPFVYEVRGLWEYTAASKHPGWEHTERFALDRRLESLAAVGADRVFTLTAALSEELVSRGVEAERIALAPNCIDPELAGERERDAGLAESLGIADAPFVAGYVGSLVPYEGLDDLMTAFGLLRERMPGARLLLVGDGHALPALRAMAATPDLSGAVVFTGKVAPAEISRYFSLLDAIALPRKPFKVCELVSPLKPLEAMAFGVPLVVSDVAALKEMVREGETALVHRAGDPAALADCLLRLAGDRGLGRRLAEAARRDVCENRGWSDVVAAMGRAYEELAAAIVPPAEMAVGLRPAPGGGLLGARLERAPCPRAAASPVPEAAPAARPFKERRDLARQEAELTEALRQDGVDGLLGQLAQITRGRARTFRVSCGIKAAHILLEGGETDEAKRLVERALSDDKTAGTLRGAARVYYNAAQLDRAGRLVDRLESRLSNIGESDRRFINEVRSRALLAQWVAAAPAPRRLPCVKDRVLNVLAFSLPYSSVGYATRSHGLALGVRHAGWDIRPYTRPGFPYDSNPELEGQTLPKGDEIDGILYQRVFDTARRGSGEVEYLTAAIPHWERILTTEQPAVVHAASNYVTALPALIAARRLGIPFVYEVRGFWEVTRISRDESFVHTPKYRFMELFEQLVARHADHVVTITTAMKEELVRRGVCEDKISISFNSVDPLRFTPRPANQELAERLGIEGTVPVIGYIGSFVDYEGLDDLVSAAAGLKQAGLDFRLLLVGNGAEYERIRQMVVELDLEDKVLLTGRVPFEMAEEYYSLVDIAPFPRKPWPVCELVSPLKPFEAMASEKAVVVSDTRALSEIVANGRTGMTFEKGSVPALERTLKKLLLDAGLRKGLGASARQWIIEERNWDRAGEVCAQAYARALEAAGQSDQAGQAGPGEP